MFRRIDRSPALARLLERLSAWLARRRGLLALIGAGLVLVSFIVHLINLSAASPALDLIWSIAHHLGILLGLIGLLLVEPLGR